jgi:hypothetical protein
VRLVEIVVDSVLRRDERLHTCIFVSSLFILHP